MQNYSIIKTDDGSSTVISPLFDEAMHSIEGAMFESVNRHVVPARILSRKGVISVLDICFGLGYNSLALLSLLKNRNDYSALHLYAAEYDSMLFTIVQTLQAPSSYENEFEIIKQVYRDGKYASDRIFIELYSGDSRNLVKHMQKGGISVDAVFHDPHSPAKNCELWTRELFNALFCIMTDDAVLTTYSSAKHVRRAMIEAGFSIEPYKGDLKKEGTLALKIHTNGCLKQNSIDTLFSDPKSTPFHDNASLSDEREHIRKNRAVAMKQARDFLRENRP